MTDPTTTTGTGTGTEFVGARPIPGHDSLRS